jgi:hypothetical membrane protein
MKWNFRLLFGLVAAAVFVLGVAGLALMVPGYSAVRQTVSEIGEVGSPARTSFTAMLCSVAGCLVIFASAVRDVSIQARHSPAAAYLIAAVAVSVAGVGVFSFPHPLHNVFGISELIGYQAPIAFAYAWRRDSRARALVTFSWIMSGVVWVTILLNLTTLHRYGVIWEHVRQTYGLVQRLLFGAWFGWTAGLGVLLFNRERRAGVLAVVN